MPPNELMIGKNLPIKVLYKNGAETIIIRVQDENSQPTQAPNKQII